MKFTTNAKCAGCRAAILTALAPLGGADVWSLDLTEPGRTLTYTGTAPVDPLEVERLVRAAGFNISPLPE